MSIIITVAPSLVLDETTGLQNGADLTIPTTDNDAELSYDSTANTLSSPTLDAAFLTYLQGLFAADAAEDAALGYAARVEGASSATNFISVTADAGESIDNLFFKVTGNGLISTATTLAGEALYFYVDPLNSDRAVLTTALGGAGRIVAAFYLDEAAPDAIDGHIDAQVQMVTFEALRHTDTANPDEPINFSDVLQVGATGSLSFDFDNVDSGNFLYVAIGTETAGLLVTGRDLNVQDGGNKDGQYIPGGNDDPSDSMNTSQGGAGATIGVNSQHFVAGGQPNSPTDGSTAVFTLVRGFVPLPTDAQATDTNQHEEGTNVNDIQYGDNDPLTADYINTTGAGLFISQLTGTNADMRISLWTAGGTGGLVAEEGFAYIGNQTDDSAFYDDIAVAVGSVTVTRGGVDYVFNGTSTNPTIGVTVTFINDAFDNTFTVTGLDALDSVSWITTGATFNRFQVTALSTTGAFDLGRVDILQGFDQSTGLGSHLFVDDDGPDVTPGDAPPELTVDETDFAGNDSASFADAFDTDFGEDGEAATDPLTYELGFNPGATGLVDTLSGLAVVLALDGDDVVGLAGVGGEEVFRVSVNSATGMVTLDQSRAIVHADAGDPDDSRTLANNDLITLTATATDGDGDQDSETIGIAESLNFEDDFPTVTLDRVPDVFATVDETDLTDDNTALGSSLLDPDIDYGNDGEGTAVYSLDVVGGGVTTLKTIGGDLITLVETADPTVVEGRYGVGLGSIAFVVSIDSSNGSVTLDQRVALDHPDDTDPDDSLYLDADRLNAVLTVTDGDGDSASDPADIGPALEFKDDGPFVTAEAVNVIVDDDGGPGGNDGGDEDDNKDRVTTGSITTLFDAGADGLDSYTLSIENFDINNPPPELNSQGSLVSYDQTANLLTGYVESGDTTGYQSDEDRDVFTFELNVGGIAGAFEFTLIDQIDHPDTTEEDNLELEIGILLEAIDNDGDTSTSAAPVQLTIVADDDSPMVVTPNTIANDATGSNDTITTEGATGNFDFAVGFDDRVGTTYGATNSDLRVTLTSGLVFNTVAGSAITEMTTAWASETADQATFTFTFAYRSDPSSSATTPTGGTIVFDKDDGTYTFTLDDPILSFGVISTATASGFVGYLPNTSTIDTSQPFATVAALADDFFVQFTGRYEASGGTDGNGTLAKNNNLDALAPGEAWSQGDDDVFSTGELFTQTANWVSISGTAAGVAGDTMQAGEVLDFNFYQSNPFGYQNFAIFDDPAVPGSPNPPPAIATTSTMFIEFDALDNGEDLVLVLKLVDKDDASITTTRVVVAQFDDIFHIAQAGEIPASFLQLGAIDQNDGMVIIEGNDYNILADDNWTIAGAQVIASTEGLTSNSNTIINLNRATGDSGGSVFYTSDPFSTIKDSGNNTGGTWDGDVFKIVNIGFLTEITPNSRFNFDVEVIDFDGDASAVQQLTIDVLGGDALAGLVAPLSASTLADAAYVDSMRNVSDFDMAIALSQANHLA
jgi:Domain of unknown function (DUF5801)